MTQRYYSSIAARTTLAGDITSGALTMAVAAVVGWPSSYPYTLIIDPDLSTEEVVTVTGRSGTTITMTRGSDGTTANAHTAGAAIQHGVSARDFSEPNTHIQSTSNPHSVTAAQTGALALAGGTVTGPTVVDVNSTSPALRVTQTGSGDALLVEDSAHPDSTPFVVNSSGNVGIGTASPDSGTPLHVKKSSASLPANPTASAFLVERAGTVAMTLGTANTGTASIFFGSPDSLTLGRVQYNNSDNSLQFWANYLERMRITNSGLITGVGPSLGAWTAYTPALGGAGWDIGNGTVSGFYCQIGKVIHFRARIVAGSTTTFGTGSPVIGILFAAADVGASLNSVAVATVYDTSAGAWYATVPIYASTSGVSIGSLGPGGLRGVINSTTPMTWTTGDEIRLSGTYEAA